MRRVLSLSAVILLLWVGLAGAATEVVCIVDTDATQNPDYTSLAAAIAGETGASPKCVTSADLVANDEQLTIECRASAGGADTTAVVLTGFTTGATNYIKIHSTGNHRHQGILSSSYYRLATTTTNTYPLDINGNCWNVRVDGIQIDAASSNRAAVMVRNLNSGTTDYRFSNLVIHGGNDFRYAAGININDSDCDTVSIWNCVIYGFPGIESKGIHHAASGGTTYIYNCTISGIAGRGLSTDSGAGAQVITNCAVFNCGDDFADTETLTIDHCASDDGDGTNAIDISPGGTEADDWNAAFTDYANGDFSVKDTDSVLYDAGTDLSGTFTTDIAGTTRSTWDIGAFEYEAGPKWNTITPAKWNGVDWSNLKWNGM